MSGAGYPGKDETNQICCVCNEPLDGENTSRCRLCGGSFHMAWSVKAQVRECGRYWLDPEHCGLNFICARCEERLRAKQAQSPSHSTTS